MVAAAGGGDAVHGGRVRLPRERLPHAHHAAPAAPRAEAARPPRQGQRGLRLLSRPGARTDRAVSRHNSTIFVKLRFKCHVSYTYGMDIYLFIYEINSTLKSCCLLQHSMCGFYRKEVQKIFLFQS